MKKNVKIYFCQKYNTHMYSIYIFHINNQTTKQPNKQSTKNKQNKMKQNIANKIQNTKHNKKNNLFSKKYIL